MHVCVLTRLIEFAVCLMLAVPTAVAAAEPSPLSLQAGPSGPMTEVPLQPAPPAPRGFCDAEDYRALFPDGRIEADSFLATPEYGERLAKTAAANVAKDLAAFVAKD